MRYRLATGVVVGLLVVTSGCLGFSAGGDHPADESSHPSGTAFSSVEDGPEAESPRPSPTAACHDLPVPYNVSVPPKPDNLTSRTAMALVKTFDRRFEAAKVKADYDNITVDTSVRELNARRIDGGFEVTISTRVQISGEDLHGKWAYSTVYRVTDRAFKREGGTIKCW